MSNEFKVYKARHAAVDRREYYKGTAVSAEQADAIKFLGGKTTNKQTDQDIWRNWA